MAILPSTSSGDPRDVIGDVEDEPSTDEADLDIEEVEELDKVALLSLVNAPHFVWLKSQSEKSSMT